MLIRFLFLPFSLELVALGFVQSENHTINPCDLLGEFEKHNLSEAQQRIYYCVAEKERFEYNLKISSLLSQNCAPFRYGLFQFTSRTCDDDENGYYCKTNICHTQCRRFQDNNLSDDIQCLKILENLNLDDYGMQACRVNPKDIKSEKEACKKLKASSGRRNDLVIYVAVICIVLLLGFVAIGTVIWIRTRNSNVIMTKQEIDDFKYGFARKIKGKQYGSVTGRKSGAIESLALQRISLKGSEQEDILAGPYDKRYEVSPNDFEIHDSEILGTGAYGIVHKATLKGTIVAMKSTKPNRNNKEYLMSLLEEIKIMTYLGKHANIVSLLGASTRSLQKGIVCIFVEFCPLGSLESMLRKNRENFLNLIDEHDLFSPLSSARDTDTERYVDVDGTETEGKISSLDLIKWSYELACGMNYLASRKVIHGDLATRNVLLLDRDTIKISDFGLSRKLYNYCNYIKTSEAQLPWRWMAIESLRDMIFSTESDVWSFGVTLWEIFSLGEVPWPGRNWSVDFLDNLSLGLRMRKPRYSSKKLFEDTMTPCWQEDPKLRPTFEKLQIYFRTLLEVVSSQDYCKVTTEDGKK